MEFNEHTRLRREDFIGAWAQSELGDVMDDAE